jgi:predicted nuclease with TOPRIM domain
MSEKVLTTDLVTELRQMAATGYAGCSIWAEAADEIERLERERAEWSGIAAQRNRNIALIAEERDKYRDEVDRLRLRLSEIHDLANPRLVLATNGAAIVRLTGEFAKEAADDVGDQHGG